MIENISQ